MGWGARSIYRQGPILIAPRRGETDSGARALLDRQEVPPHLPCPVYQLGAVAFGTGNVPCNRVHF